MNWTNYWAQRNHQPQVNLMNKHPEYTEWLQDKNLATNTIRSYLDTLGKFKQEFTTPGVKAYFRANLQKYAPTTLKVQKYALNSYLKFKQLKIEWEKIARLIPQVQKKFFATINEPELTLLKKKEAPLSMPGTIFY